MEKIALMAYVEIDISCILLLLYILYKSFHNVEQRESWRYYQYSLCFITLFIFSDLIWELMEFHVLPNVPLAAYLVNATYFVLSMLATGYWFLFTEAELEISMIRKRAFRIFAVLPIAVFFVLLIISYFNGCLFYFDSNGHFVRGPLNILAFFFPLIYLLAAVIHPVVRIFKKQYYIHRKHYLSLSMFALITFLASFLQIFLPGTPLPCLGISAASLMMYMNTQELLISLDPLTKLNNRYQMIRHLSQKMEHPDKDEHLFLFLLDLDRFKQINDTYGHIEGDQALVCLATVLKSTAAKFNCFVSRYGGDEFIIIHETKHADEKEAICAYIHEQLEAYNKVSEKPYHLRTSIGAAVYNPALCYVPEFIAQADNALYEVKRKKALLR